MVNVRGYGKVVRLNVYYRVCGVFIPVTLGRRACGTIPNTLRALVFIFLLLLNCFSDRISALELF